MSAALLYEDVSVPNYYRGQGQGIDEKKEEERSEATRKALLRFFNRLPEEQQKRIYFMEFEPWKDSLRTYRGRFRVGDSTYESEWFECAKRLIAKQGGKWCDYCKTIHSDTNCPNCRAPRRAYSRSA